MKIAIDISQAVYGTGVSVYTSNLVHYLKLLDKNNQYLPFGYSLRQKKHLANLFPGSLILPFPPTFMGLIWNQLHKINLETFTGPVDIYHSSDWTQAPSKALKVTTVHDLSPILFPEEMRGTSFRNITKNHTLRLKRVIDECDKIICVSQATASDLIKLFAVEQGRVVVIYEALPQGLSIIPSSTQISKIKDKYSLTNYVVVNSTLQPRKNIVRLINAFLNFRNRFQLPDQLVITGSRGWGNLDLPRHPSVIITGFLTDNDLASLIKGAEVMAQVSLYEGFSLPLLAAFHHRVPVVASNTSSHPETAGDAAIFVDPKNEEDIARGISEAASNKHKLIALGLKQLSKFSWEKTAQETIAVYNALSRKK